MYSTLNAPAYVEMLIPSLIHQQATSSRSNKDYSHNVLFQIVRSKNALDEMMKTTKMGIFE